MNKCRFSFIWSILSIIVLFSMVLFSSWALAASTIGTNMSTTGTFTITPASDSATSVQFQNAAGTNIFIVNSTARWIGVGAAPQTTFEVQGTASASYLFAGNTLQVGGYASTASVAYNRFGTGTTSQSTFVTTTNDLLITGDLEVDGKAFFDTTASVGGAFEVVGRASASTGFVTGSFVVGNNAASSSTAYVAEFGAGKTGTISLLFGSSTAAATTGTCLQMKNTQGAWVYLRINGTSSLSLDIDTVKCHP